MFKLSQKYHASRIRPGRDRIHVESKFEIYVDPAVDIFLPGQASDHLVFSEGNN